MMCKGAASFSRRTGFRQEEERRGGEEEKNTQRMETGSYGNLVFFVSQICLNRGHTLFILLRIPMPTHN